MRSEFEAATFMMLSPRSEHRDLVVEDEPECLSHVFAAVFEVSVAESELQPPDPRHVPRDVEVALVDPWKRAVVPPGVARVGARGVAHEHRDTGNIEGQQGAFVEVVFGADTPRVLAGAVEVLLLKREVTGPRTEGCLQCRATARRVEGRPRGEAPPVDAAASPEAQRAEVTRPLAPDASL